MFLSGSHGTSPGKVKAHLWFWLSKPIGETFASSGWRQSTSAPGSDKTRTPRRRSGRRATIPECLLRSAGVPRRQRRSSRGALALHCGYVPFGAGAGGRSAAKILAGKKSRQVGPASTGAGGTSGGWRGILESMGDANGNGFHAPMKMAAGLYVRLYGADCNPQPFFEVLDR